jgi:hypothetical protein
VNKFSWLDGVEGDELEAPSKRACARGVFSKEGTDKICKKV